MENKAHSDQIIFAKHTGSTISSAKDPVTIHRAPTLDSLVWARGDACFELVAELSCITKFQIHCTIYCVRSKRVTVKGGLKLGDDFSLFLDRFGG